MLLALKVVPNASRDRVVGVLAMPDGDRLKVSVTSPPEGGKANKAVVALLRKQLNKHGLRPEIELVAGHTQAAKLVRLSGLNLEDFPKAWLGER